MEAAERLVFLDTETTGLDARSGHRIIEVAGIEAVGRDLTGRHLHFYLDPEREIDAGATAVHGYTWDDLRGKPKFATIVHELLAFLVGASVVIHNAPFDVSFLNHELARLRMPSLSSLDLVIVDSLALAKEKVPGKRNSLDALCDRLGVDNSQRNLHGALLDARLLAEVYFGLTRGQGAFEMELPHRCRRWRLTTVPPTACQRRFILSFWNPPCWIRTVTISRLAKQSGVERPWG
jgi:DNA polymerase-3 subunit epsilon